MSAEGESGGDAAGNPQSTGKLARLGKFFQTYHTFLSSFVIGVAGLVATSIWQYRQSQIAAQQAQSEQTIARTKAENDWRIARAEILSKNLNVLSAQGPGSADQRFGVLLSLTRGAIIDPELAVSYAMELGKDNPTYMRTVLEATGQKNYQQLTQGFKLTCLQRFGVARAIELCKDDALAERSEAIAQVVNDEMDATTAAHGPVGAGPMSLLREEREVQARPAKLAWLFDPYLEDLYDRRVWQEIQRFENFSPGAHLVAALTLATARTGEMASSAEAAQIEKFHADHRKWLASYLLGASCGGDCRGKLVNAMLSGYLQAGGDYDEPFRQLLTQPRAESASAFAHLHKRFLWCQIDPDAESQFRDQVLVAAFEAVNAAMPVTATKGPTKGTATKSAATKGAAATTKRRTEQATIEDLVDLLALVPEPQDTDASASAAWKNVMTVIDHSGDHLGRTYNARREASARERANPPPMIRKVDFCGAPPLSDTTAGAKP